MLIRDVCEKLGDVMIIGQGVRGPNPDKTAIAAFARAVRGGRGRRRDGARARAAHRLGA